MEKTHNEQANATYYTLDVTTDRKVEKTVTVSEHCLVDIDAEGFPIGVEVLS